MIKRSFQAFLAFFLAGGIFVQAADPIRVGGSIRYRPVAPRPPAVRPPLRPGAGPVIRHEIRQEIRREIRRERRNRAIFFGAMAVLGTVLRSLPQNHTTIVVNQKTYFFANGNYYIQSGGGYTVVPAPYGAVVPVLPGEYSMPVMVGNQEYFYSQGFFYQRATNGYVTIAPPLGAVVNVIPDGAARRGSLLEYNGTFYREIANGEYVDYEVVKAP